VNGPRIVIEIPHRQLEAMDRTLREQCDRLLVQARKMTAMELFFVHATLTSELVRRGMAVMHLGQM